MFFSLSCCIFMSCEHFFDWKQFSCNLPTSTVGIIQNVIFLDRWRNTSDLIYALCLRLYPCSSNLLKNAIENLWSIFLFAKSASRQSWLNKIMITRVLHYLRRDTWIIEVIFHARGGVYPIWFHEWNSLNESFVLNVYVNKCNRLS